MPNSVSCSLAKPRGEFQKPETNLGKTAKRDDDEQSKLFTKKAREIGADEDHSEADVVIEQLAKKPPDPRKKGS